MTAQRQIARNEVWVATQKSPGSCHGLQITTQSGIRIHFTTSCDHYKHGFTKAQNSQDHPKTTSRASSFATKKFVGSLWFGDEVSVILEGCWADEAERPGFSSVRGLIAIVLAWCAKIIVVLHISSARWRGTDLWGDHTCFLAMLTVFFRCCPALYMSPERWLSSSLKIWVYQQPLPSSTESAMWCTFPKGNSSAHLQKKPQIQPHLAVVPACTPSWRPSYPGQRVEGWQFFKFAWPRKQLFSRPRIRTRSQRSRVWRSMGGGWEPPPRKTRTQLYPARTALGSWESAISWCEGGANACALEGGERTKKKMLPVTTQKISQTLPRLRI